MRLAKGYKKKESVFHCNFYGVCGSLLCKVTYPLLVIKGDLITNKEFDHGELHSGICRGICSYFIGVRLPVLALLVPLHCICRCESASISVHSLLPIGNYPEVLGRWTTILQGLHCHLMSTSELLKKEPAIESQRDLFSSWSFQPCSNLASLVPGHDSFYRQWPDSDTRSTATTHGGSDHG